MELRRWNKKIKVFAIVVVLIFVFLAINLAGFSNQVRNTFYLISSPIQKIFWKAGDRVSDIFGGIYGIENFKKENQELKRQNKELLGEIAELKEIKAENKMLREALDLELQKDFELILVEIIAKDIGRDFILINKGADNGILEDLPVITAQKAVCGKIKEVYKNFSKVMLISDKHSSFDVKLQEKDISGVAKGKGNLSLYLGLIPWDKEILEGDIIVTTALGGIFPKGLLVGELKEIQKSDLDPYQKADISSFFNIKETESLFVILK